MNKSDLKSIYFLINKSFIINYSYCKYFKTERSVYGRLQCNNLLRFFDDDFLGHWDNILLPYSTDSLQRNCFYCINDGLLPFFLIKTKILSFRILLHDLLYRTKKCLHWCQIRAVDRQKVHPQVFLLCQMDHLSLKMHACINLALVLDHFLLQLLRCSKFYLLASRRDSNLASSLFYLWTCLSTPQCSILRRSDLFFQKNTHLLFILLHPLTARNSSSSLNGKSLINQYS